MIEYIKNLWSTPYMALYLYWIPMGLSLIEGIHHVIKEYIKELGEYREACKKNKSHYPNLCVGDILLSIIPPFIPVINIFLTVFRCVPTLWKTFFSTFGKFLDFKLVPAREKTPNIPNEFKP